MSDVILISTGYFGAGAFLSDFCYLLFFGVITLRVELFLGINDVGAEEVEYGDIDRVSIFILAMSKPKNGSGVNFFGAE